MVYIITYMVYNTETFCLYEKAFNLLKNAETEAKALRACGHKHVEIKCIKIY